MRRSAILCVPAAALVLAAAPLGAGETPPANLVVNGDFSGAAEGKPLAWVSSGNPETVTQTLETVEDDGNPCVRLVCTRCEGTGGWTHAMICQVGGVRLTKDRAYAFSCRARAEGIAGRNVRVAIQDTDGWHPCGFRTELPLAETWKEFRHVFKAARTAHETTRLQFWYNEPGTLYLDDVRIVEMDAEKVVFTNVVPDAKGKNLVPNGSFEVGPWGWSSTGTRTGWGDLARLHGSVEASGGADGERFLRTSLGEEHTPVLRFDYYEAVERRQTCILAANRGWIPVEPGAQYVVSCAMRSSVEGTRAVVGVKAKDPARGRWDWRSHTTHVTLSTSWKRYAHCFTAEYPYVYVTVGPDLEKERRVDVDIDAVQLEKDARPTDYEPHAPLEVGLEPSEPSGIFTHGVPARLTVLVRNHSKEDRTIRLRLGAKDYFDRPADLGFVEIGLTAGETTEETLELPKEWRGHYRLDAGMEYGDPPHVIRRPVTVHPIPLAFVPARTGTDTVLGVNHAFAPDYLIRLARKAGVTWYRDWSLKWDHVEPRRGQYRWRAVDPQIDRVRNEHAHVVALLPPFPSAKWISEAPGGIPGKGYPESRLPAAWAPKDPALLGGFVEKAARRYRDRVKVWEFLNEPVYTTYALPGKDKASLEKYGGVRYTPADYVRLLAVAAAAMKRADGACRVMGGIGGGPDTLTKEVIEAGCLKHVDIFNLHIYPGKRSPEGFIPGMEGLLARMDEHGGRKPIWITEFSYYGVDNLPRAPFVPSGGSWAEERLLESERACAEYTVRFTAVMLSCGVEKVFLHSGASGSVNDPSPECCLFDYGGAPRRAFAAMAVLTELLGPAPRCVGRRRAGSDGYGAAFETGARSVAILWRTSAGGTDLTVRMPGELRDIMGGRLSGNAVTLSESPVYAVAPKGQAQALLDGVASR